MRGGVLSLRGKLRKSGCNDAFFNDSSSVFFASFDEGKLRGYDG